MCRSFSNFYIITSIYYLVNDFLYVYIAYLSLYLINYKAAASFFYIMSLFLASLFITICYYMYLFLSITDKRSFYLQVRVANTATLNSLLVYSKQKRQSYLRNTIAFINTHGTCRARTCDPLIKSQLLYQLS